MPAPNSYCTPGVYVEWLDANPQHIELGQTDVAGFVGIADRGPVQTPVKIESKRQFLTTFGDQVPHAYLGYAVAGFFENGGRTCWVVRVADEDRALAARLRLLIAGRPPFVLEATTPGVWGNEIVIDSVWGPNQIEKLIASTPDGRSQPVDLDEIDALSQPARPEVWTNLLGVADSDLPELAPDIIVRKVPDNPTVTSQELSARTRSVRLSGGVEGLSSLTTDHFTGHPDFEARWGVAALERIDVLSFVAVPDLMYGQDATSPQGEFRGFDKGQIRDAQIRIITSCMRCRDRIAILDMPPVSRDQVVAYKDKWPNVSFAAFYHPWVVVNDPRIRGIVRTIPPSGHVAGMYARTDRLRGVHKPPANEVLEGVWDVRETIDDLAHGELNDSAVNAIRAIPGRGVLVLGARTLDPDVRWRYVNVRRLFAMIEKALDEQMQWLTFEPSNPGLWREIDRAVRGFLERLFRLGMLDGGTSEQAYSVRCDASTNPTWETDEGRVTCVIGVQPPYPAEFVVVRIGVTRSGIEIEEKGAQDV